jgi:hypothetical protein
MFSSRKLELRSTLGSESTMHVYLADLKHELLLHTKLILIGLERNACIDNTMSSLRTPAGMKPLDPSMMR